MSILIGSLIRDRGEITQCFLRHLRALDLSGLEASWFFVIDGEWLWYDDLPEGSHYLSVADAGPYYERKPRGPGDVRPEFRRLAFLRNILRERALMEQADGLISIDSDICPPADLVQRLVSAGKPWVAALVDNSALLNRQHDPELWRMRGEAPPPASVAFNILDFTEEGRCRHPAPDLEQGGEVDITGAVCYYSQELLLQAWWWWNPFSEDVGFSANANGRGYRAHYLPLVCDHLMTEARLQSHKKGCSLCR